jgi:hypothetical protein
MPSRCLVPDFSLPRASGVVLLTDLVHSMLTAIVLLTDLFYSLVITAIQKLQHLDHIMTHQSIMSYMLFLKQSPVVASVCLAKMVFDCYISTSMQEL